MGTAAANRLKVLIASRCKSGPYNRSLKTNGKGEIRTPGTVSRTLVFETSPFSRSGTSPSKRPAPSRWANLARPTTAADSSPDADIPEHIIGNCSRRRRGAETSIDMAARSRNCRDARICIATGQRRDGEANDRPAAERHDLRRDGCDCRAFPSAYRKPHAR